MKTTRIYSSICTTCCGEGFIRNKSFNVPVGMTSTMMSSPCPVCGGNKTIMITET